MKIKRLLIVINILFCNSKLMSGEIKIRDHVENGISTLINKFREYPDIFFTETDLHSYLYHNLYTSKLEYETSDGRITNCLHKEYPTNYRYTKKDMQEYGLAKEGKRGNVDLVILNPAFIENNTLRSITSRILRDVEKRAKNTDQYRKEVHSVIEMKYITTNTKTYLEEVRNDNKKLLNGLRYQDFNTYNLVFCNLNCSQTRIRTNNQKHH